jgi:hypothetical protein
MRRFFVFPLFGLGALFTLYLAPFARNEAQLRRPLDASGVALALPADPAALEHGRHIARTRGCRLSWPEARRQRLRRVWDWPERAVAPNLALYAKEHPAGQPVATDTAWRQ